MPSPDARQRLDALAAHIHDQFSSTRRVLSFDEWLALVVEHPTRHLRNAAQYTRDAFDFFGRRKVRTPSGEVTRYRIFDDAWEKHRPADPDEGVSGRSESLDKLFIAQRGRRLVGQEEAQKQLYEALDGFCRLGRVDKLLLLQGPNGSAKSTLLECIERGLEVYSETEQGALYRFAWVFPTKEPKGGGIGFGAAGLRDTLGEESYARLDGDAIDARVTDETKDHPIFLIPVDQRQVLLDEMCGADDDFVVSETIRRGQLSARNYKIYEALLKAYQGDLKKVLQHVQVERLYLSRNYRTGLVDVEPKQTVDARSFPVTGDKAFAPLPAAVGGQMLYGAQGDLVEANRGLITFSDLLKRPYEHYKYLLTAVEGGRVSLDHVVLNLDMVFMGSINDLNLLAFREQNAMEYQSFRARLDLIEVRYLLDYRVERKIYSEQIGDLLRGVHIAPHVERILALWGVMTRLRRPDPDKYDKRISSVLKRLTPLEKADLYAYGRVPEGLSSEEARELLAAVPQMHRERFGHAFVRIDGRTVDDYEGSFGASVRDLKGVLLDAASEPNVEAVTVPRVFEHIRMLLRDKANHRWMNLQPDAGFHLLDGDEASITEAAWVRWLDLSEREVREALGLVDEERYLELFRKYVFNIRHAVKGEKIYDDVTGDLADPDEKFMAGLEKSMDPAADAAIGDKDDRKKFREEVLARIGAWALSHPNEDPALDEIFPDYFARLREDYYRQQKDTVAKGIRSMLEVLKGDDARLDDAEISDADKSRARKAVKVLLGEGDKPRRERHTKDTLKETLVYLSKTRY